MTVTKQHEILIVEDSPTQAAQLKYILEQQAYQVRTAADGILALALLKDHKPDLIISDISMPKMNGYQLCQHIKDEESTGDIPVILLTSLTNPEDVLEGLACGADSFITKPYNKEYLLNHIQQILINRIMYKSDRVRVGMEIQFGGKRRFISANQQQMLSLLLSTYGAAIQRNSELDQAQAELQTLNEELEERVIERTAALSAEIMERKAAQNALQESNAFNTQLLQTIPFGINIINQAGEIIFMNPAMERNFGTDALGKTCWELFRDDQQQCHNCPLKDNIQAGEIITQERSGMMGGRIFEIHYTPLTFQGEKGVMAIYHDITQIKTAETAIQRRMSELEAMYASSISINTLHHPVEIGEKIIKILTDKLQQEYVTVHLHNPIDGCLTLLAFHQPGMENKKDRAAKSTWINKQLALPDQGLTGWVIQHGKAVYSPDVTNDVRYIALWENIHSGLYVPLKTSEGTIGCLSVQSEKKNAFDETDEWLITTLATQVTSALENARLLEETRHHLNQTLALREIDKAIVSYSELDQVLDTILKYVLSEFDVDAADILLYDLQDQVLKYQYGKGFHTTALQCAYLSAEKSYAGTVFQERKILHIADLGQNTTESSQNIKFQTEGFKAYCGIPLTIKDNVIGVLEVFSKTQIKVNQEILSFMETLAGQVAVGINKTNLYRDLQQSNRELHHSYDATIEGWSHALDLRDKETEGHTQRVTELTLKLAHAMEIHKEDLLHIRRGALLHDIGKMGVPDNILLKPGPLTNKEWIQMRKHPQYAYDLLHPIQYLHPALDIPYCHHEKWDGSGYPQGLKGEEIPLSARIFAIVDVYDAVTSDRPYRTAWSQEQAIAHIQAERGKHFDPAVVDIFLMLMDKASSLQ